MLITVTSAAVFDARKEFLHATWAHRRGNCSGLFAPDLSLFLKFPNVAENLMLWVL